MRVAGRIHVCWFGIKKMANIENTAMRLTKKDLAYWWHNQADPSKQARGGGEGGWAFGWIWSSDKSILFT